MQFTKHIHVLSLLSTIPARGSVTPQEAIDCWDHLFTYIHAKWAEPLTARSSTTSERNERSTVAEQVEILDCRKMLGMNHDELIAKLESLPPYFTEAIFPVAVARYLLRDLYIPLNHKCTKTFNEFVRRYGTMVLS